MDSGILAERLRQVYSCDVECFGSENNWDLTDYEHQKAFLDYMDRGEPDELWIAPMRDPWILRTMTAEASEKARKVEIMLRQMFSPLLREY